MKSKKFLTIVLILAALAAGVVIGVYIGRSTAADDSAPEEDTEASGDDAGSAAQSDVQEVVEGLLELFAAWDEFSSREIVAAEVEVSAEFGLFSISDDFEWERGYEDGVAVNHIEINGLSFDFTDDELTGESDESSVDPYALLALLYEVFLEGGISIEAADDGYLYSIELSKSQMEELVPALIPGAADMDIEYETGELIVVVADEVLDSVSISCGGSVGIWITEFGISLDAVMDFV